MYIKSIDSIPVGSQQVLTQVVGEIALPSTGGSVLPFRPFTQSLIFQWAASPSTPIDTPGIIAISGDILALEPSDELSSASQTGTGGTTVSEPVAQPSHSASASLAEPAPRHANPSLQTQPNGAAASAMPVSTEMSTNLAFPKQSAHVNAPSDVVSTGPSLNASSSSTSTSTVNPPATIEHTPATLSATTITKNHVPSASASPSTSKQSTWASALASKGKTDAVGIHKTAPTTDPATSAMARRPSAVSATSSTATGGARLEGPKAAASTTASKPSHTRDASVFLKSVADNIQVRDLFSALKQFGSVENVHMVHGKQCAFVDFDTPETARRALEASRARGGVRVPSVAGQPTILVEPKRRDNQDPPKFASKNRVNKARQMDHKADPAKGDSKKGGGDTKGNDGNGDKDGFETVPTKGRRGRA